MVEKNVLPLSDGRRLAYHDLGEGPPILYAHGLPSSSHEIFAVPAAREQHRLRWIAADRPGYGHSTHDPRRTADSLADDYAALLDHLRIGRVRMLCVSGGTPGTLAFIHRHPARVERLAVLCGMGLMGGAAQRARMRQPLRLGVRAARLAPAFAHTVFHPWSRPLIYPFASSCRKLGLLLSSPADRTAFSHTAFREALEESWRQAFMGGGPGMARDLHAWTRDSGAWLGELSLPVQWWHGDADRVVPHGVGAAMAATIPGCVLHTWPGEGHFSLIEKALPTALGWLSEE